MSILKQPLNDIPDGLDVALIVRGIAAYQVLIWHTVGFDVTGWAAKLFMVSGRQCVWVFFTLSGYLIAYGFYYGRYPLNVAGIKRFYAARLLRIVPLYLFLTLLTVASLFAVGAAQEITPARVIRALLFLSVDHVYPGPFWTLVLEFWFYVLFPLFAWIIFMIPEHRRLSISIGMYLALGLVPHLMTLNFGHSLDNRTLVGNFSHFFAGILILLLAKQIQTAAKNIGPRRLLWHCFTLAAVLLIFTTYWYHAHQVLFYVLGGFTTDLMALALLVIHKVVEIHDRPPRPILQYLSVLGILAYGIYAWHGFLLVVVPELTGKLATVSIISIMLAWLSYSLIERPMLTWRKNHLLVDLPGKVR